MLFSGLAGCSTFINAMADYYSIMAKAVCALDRNTGDARRRLYDRARTALLAEMRSVDLALDLSDIMAAQMRLEEAIGKIEADAGPEEPAQVAIDTPSTTSPRGGVVAAPRPPANQNDEQRRRPLTRLWARVFCRAGVGAPKLRRSDTRPLPPQVRLLGRS